MDFQINDENGIDCFYGGMDCSGSVLYALFKLGNKLPDKSASEIYEMTYPTDDDILPGDLRFLRDEDGNVSHVQVLIDSTGARVNAKGDDKNTKENPGIIEFLEGPLPDGGEIRRFYFK